MMLRRGLPDVVEPAVSAALWNYYLLTQALQALASGFYRIALCVVGGNGTSVSISVSISISLNSLLGQRLVLGNNNISASTGKSIIHIMLCCLPLLLHMPFFKQENNAPHLRMHYAPYKAICRRLVVVQACIRALGIIAVLGLSQHPLLSTANAWLYPSANTYFVHGTFASIYTLLYSICHTPIASQIMASGLLKITLVAVFLILDFWMAMSNQKAYQSHYAVYNDARWRDPSHPCHQSTTPTTITAISNSHRHDTSSITDPDDLAHEIDLFRLEDDTLKQQRPYSSPLFTHRRHITSAVTTNPQIPSSFNSNTAPMNPTHTITPQIPWHAGYTGARALNSFGHHNNFRAAMDIDIRRVNQNSIPRGFCLSETVTKGKEPVSQQDLITPMGILLHGERQRQRQRDVMQSTITPRVTLNGQQSWLPTRFSTSQRSPSTYNGPAYTTDDNRLAYRARATEYESSDDDNDLDNTSRTTMAKAYENNKRKSSARRTSMDIDNDDDNDGDVFGMSTVQNIIQHCDKEDTRDGILRSRLKQSVAYDLHPVHVFSYSHLVHSSIIH